MARSIVCRILGCRLDPCGICTRCKDASQARHVWKETARTKRCYRLSVCERCGSEREQPDHDWQPGPAIGGDSSLVCARCGLSV